jgi:hypothetical protein
MKNKNSKNKLQDAAGIFICIFINLQPELFFSRSYCIFSLSLAKPPAPSIAQCTQTLHQQMHKATLRTCTTTHTTNQKKRI